MRALHWALPSLIAVTLASVQQPAMAQKPSFREPSAPGSPILFWRLGALNNSGPRQPILEVIQDEERWKSIWGVLYATHIHENYIRAPQPPKIDFSREVIVVLALGQRGSGGHAIQATSVLHGQDRTEIIVRRQAPGEGCAVTLAFTYPVDIIRMEIPSKPIAILTEDVTVNCK